jgi:choline dehydrogenase
MMDEFDFVIVGGGTAAGILAYRLSEAGSSVCVLEAGPPDRNPYIRIPAGFMKTLFNPKVTWQLASEPNPNTNSRIIEYTQGKTLGGSSSVNGMVYTRGQAADFNEWAQRGNLGWGYHDILPYFRRTEQWTGKSDVEYRGDKGRLKTSISPWPNAVVDAFVASAQSVGHKFNPDYNGAQHEGVGFYQSAIWRGRRNSTATAFLHPAQRAWGVDIRTQALVTRIILKEGAAKGVTYTRGGKSETVLARTEVIVSAGAGHSPKLLQLSGVGPAWLLQKHGIEVQHELPGVGENFRDHYSPRLVVRAKDHVDTLNAHVTGMALGREIGKWLTGRPSVLSISPALVYVYGKTNPVLQDPDYSLVFTPGSYKQGFIGRLDDFPGMTCGAWQMRPDSTGYVRIKSADPLDPPILNANYLDKDTDQKVLVGALKAARTILEAPPLAPFVEAELFPGKQLQSDDEWLAFARQYGFSSYHLVGSCRMGPASAPLTVVDDRLRVHGIRALRVVDASIMPTMPSANTYAATMMVAEKAADMIIADHQIKRKAAS